MVQIKFVSLFLVAAATILPALAAPAPDFDGESDLYTRDLESDLYTREFEHELYIRGFDDDFIVLERRKNTSPLYISCKAQCKASHPGLTKIIARTSCIRGCKRNFPANKINNKVSGSKKKPANLDLLA